MQPATAACAERAGNTASIVVGSGGLAHRSRGGTTHMTTVELDADFLALPLEAVRGAALKRARALGCEHAEVASSGSVSNRANCVTHGSRPRRTTSSLGIGLRVVKDGSLGFAATVELHRRSRHRPRGGGRDDGRSHLLRPSTSASSSPRSPLTASPPGRRPIVSTRPRFPWLTRSPCSRTGAAGCWARPAWIT